MLNETFSVIFKYCVQKKSLKQKLIEKMKERFERLTCCHQVLELVAEVFSSKEVLYLVSSGRNPGLIPNECV